MPNVEVALNLCHPLSGHFQLPKPDTSSLGTRSARWPIGWERASDYADLSKSRDARTPLRRLLNPSEVPLLLRIIRKCA